MNIGIILVTGFIFPIQYKNSLLQNTLSQKAIIKKYYYAKGLPLNTGNTLNSP